MIDFGIYPDMTSNGRFTYAWDAENHLTLASNDTHAVRYAYDHQGRMIWKEVSDVSNNHKLKTINLLWDGWDIIRETVTDHPSLTTNHTYYVWGIDLSGTLQGAGGVGGLLAVIKDDNIYAPTYDANGNVSEYVSLNDNSITAHYEYDPFGDIVAQAGGLADSFTFRFSTKPHCPLTGIVHYQLRPYSPPLGRFLPRDPIGEQGGQNLYGFVENDGINFIDVVGLAKQLSGKNPSSGKRPTSQSGSTSRTPYTYPTSTPLGSIKPPTPSGAGAACAMANLPGLAWEVFAYFNQESTVLAKSMARCQSQVPMSPLLPDSPFPVITAEKCKCCVIWYYRIETPISPYYEFYGANVLNMSCSRLRDATDKLYPSSTQCKQFREMLLPW